MYLLHCSKYELCQNEKKENAVGHGYYSGYTNIEFEMNKKLDEWMLLKFLDF